MYNIEANYCTPSTQTVILWRRLSYTQLTVLQNQIFSMYQSDFKAIDEINARERLKQMTTTMTITEEGKGRMCFVSWMPVNHISCAVHTNRSIPEIFVRLSACQHQYCFCCAYHNHILLSIECFQMFQHCQSSGFSMRSSINDFFQTHLTFTFYILFNLITLFFLL